MSELDHILAVHRAERRRQDAAADIVLVALGLIGYGVFRLIGWLL